MAILLSCQSISKSYSSRPLFKGISFGIEDGERVGLIGPNGAGKTTLVDVLSGIVEPDEGSVVRRRQLRIAGVTQNPSLPADATIFDCISASAQTAEFEPHERAASIESTLDTLGFPDRQSTVGTLSGGWQKRVAIGCAVVQQPELLFMDEPTNHLDFEGILWLEKYLKSAKFSYLLVSHDRTFLENVTSRIIELNPAYAQGFISVAGPYSDFLVEQEQVRNAQLHLQQALASKVRREIAWLQRGARARQTKSRSRIDEAGRLVDELAEVKTRNTLNRQVEIEFDASGRRTKELVSLKHVSKSMGPRHLIKDLSPLITSRTRLGLVGRNGSGKTTLLRLLIGDLAADGGEIKRAPELKIVWFDQNRAQLDQSQSLKDSLC